MELGEVVLPVAPGARGLISMVPGSNSANTWPGMKQRIRGATRCCFEAGRQSIVAFDGLPGHHVVATNIHGTTHAYHFPPLPPGYSPG